MRLQRLLQGWRLLLHPVACWEGLRFLFIDARPRGGWLPSKKYLVWRLGTVYGTFVDKDCQETRPLLDMLEQAVVGDLENVVRHLLWRRRMRARANRRRI